MTNPNPEVAAVAGSSVPMTCIVCGKDYFAPHYRVKVGRGRTCSRSCAGKHAARAFAASRPKPTEDDLINYLWENVSRGDEGECWNWVRSASVKGRGVVSFRGFRILAPRLAYRAGNGAWPPAGLNVCHTCDNPSCCNPAHLWLGTTRDNARDMVAKGRCNPSNRGVAKCKRGHPYDARNTYTDQRGRRTCKVCKVENGRIWRIRRRELANV